MACVHNPTSIVGATVFGCPLYGARPSAVLGRASIARSVCVTQLGRRAPSLRFRILDGAHLRMLFGLPTRAPRNALPPHVLRAPSRRRGDASRNRVDTFSVFRLSWRSRLINLSGIAASPLAVLMRRVKIGQRQPRPNPTLNLTPNSGAAHRRWVPSAATPLRRRLAPRWAS